MIANIYDYLLWKLLKKYKGMSQSDVLIFINVASWVFILFFLFYFFLYGKFLPSVFKNIRLHLVAELLVKKQFFNFFLNFLDKLFWYKSIFKKIDKVFVFIKNSLNLDIKFLYNFSKFTSKIRVQILGLF